MPVNSGLAHLSNVCLLSTVVLYALAMLAYAGDFAFGKRTPQGAAAEPATAESATAGQAAVPSAVPVGAVVAGAVVAGAGAGVPAEAPATPAGPPREGLAGTSGAVAAAGVSPDGPGPQTRRAGHWVRAALALTMVGLAAHVTGVLSRGLAEHRVPWGNMDEFITAITCAAVIAFLVVLARYRVFSLGLFVMTPVVVCLGLAVTILYTAAGPVVPALQSYWIAIHVTAMTIAIGSFIVATVMTVLYLAADRHARRSGDSTASRWGTILAFLPSRETLDRLSYRTVVFAFPVWTFGIIAGAIWADQAWGRYWGWDPKETWSFITWVVYAGYLHARATSGWRGRTAAYIQLLGFVCLLFNVVGVNLWITGLHSYAGIG
ncbi:MAG TPA: c-type cytochrome biogenesis protein CcsB [Streptosporangiaceae bacterium]|nr:c-type cytochrome biogenesis protein CcsB [Streptosporangiaceae bacterium]